MTCKDGRWRIFLNASMGVAGSNPVVRSTRTHHEARSASRWSGLDPEEPYSTREAGALLSPGLVPSLRCDVVLSHPSVSSRVLAKGAGD